jgi:hypothetical protein
MLRFLHLWVVLMSISGCGFKPMLAKDNQLNFALHNIKIGKVEADNPVKTERLLVEVLNIEHSSNVLYKLDVTITSRTESQAIQKDGVTSRFRVRSDLKYSLQDLATRNIIDSGQMHLYGSYNVAYSDFMNYMSSRYVSDNLLRDLFVDLKNRLSLVLMAKENIK